MDIVADNGAGEFPAGLKFLIVDNDRASLAVLEKMLRKLFFQVTACQHSSDALALLREDSNQFDIVICDLHMDDLDGLELSDIIVSDMDLPVVMTSSDERRGAAFKSVIGGVCDYLVKPVHMNTVKVIWQHVVRKKKDDFQLLPDGIEDININDVLKHTNEVDKSGQRCSKGNDGGSSDDATTLKKSRVVWSQELHDLFVTAVHQLGSDKAVPKKILERMRAMDDAASRRLTRANIASHLQKYRVHLCKLNGNKHHNPYYNQENLQFQPTLTTSYQQRPLQNHVGRGANILDSNIVKTEDPLHDLSRFNSLYQDGFVPGPTGLPAAIKNEENWYLGNGIDHFSGLAGLFYDHSYFLPVNVQDLCREPFYE